MCTLSWQYSPAGLDLFFNRDESLQRPEAGPPVVECRDGVSTVMPIDPLGGGTWIAANSQGLIIALLNNYRYPSRVSAGQSTSRGLLVRRLSSARNVAEVRAFLWGEILSRYPPFILLAFNSQPCGPFKWEWTGETLKETRDLAEMTISSSSLMPYFVPALRRYLVRQALKRCEPGQAVGRLMDLHRNKHGWPDSVAIAMKRKGRATVSMSHIRVTDTDVTFRYWPGFPGSNNCAAGVSVLQRPG
jgi:transport and Golgi organization protein 2